MIVRDDILATGIYNVYDMIMWCVTWWARGLECMFHYSSICISPRLSSLLVLVCGSCEPPWLFLTVYSVYTIFVVKSYGFYLGLRNEFEKVTVYDVRCLLLSVQCDWCDVQLLNLGDELFLEPLINIMSCLLCCQVCVTGSIPGL